MSNIRLWFKDSAIQDAGDFLCLTDMWRAAGSDESKRPVEWLRTIRGQEFVNFIRENLKVGNAHVEVLRTIRGGTEPATWGHWQVSMAYAQYLSPEFHAWCNDVVRKVMRGAPLESAALTSLITTVTAIAEAVSALAARMTKIENNQAALWSHISEGGYIAPGRFDQLWRERRTLAEVEVALGKWKDRRSALEGITRDMRDATNWGGAGKPWKRLPAGLEPAARAVIDRRMKDVTRGSKVKAQLSLLKNA